jgi:hypothetical protein
VWLTSQRYQQGGLEQALHEGPVRGKNRLLDTARRQRLIALVCSPPRREILPEWIVRENGAEFRGRP